jgi:hypothetical protein
MRILGPPRNGACGVSWGLKKESSKLIIRRRGKK